MSQDATNFKAFSRRGRCHQYLGRWAEAVKDFERVVELEGTPQARKQLEEAALTLKQTVCRARVLTAAHWSLTTPQQMPNATQVPRNLHC